jgi:ribonucleoside-diphosphate reductase alpha chain
MTTNPEIPFAKSMPDYIMRWLASRFLDADTQEDLGILTPAVRARKAAQDAMTSHSSDTSVPAADIHDHDHDHDHGGNGNGNGGNGGNGGNAGNGGNGKASTPAASASQPAASAFTDTPPVVPATTSKSPFGLDLGPACQQCGGMMQRTGACYTCSSCGFNTGCG